MNSYGPWVIITQIWCSFFVTPLEQIHLGVAAANFLATWNNKKLFWSWTGICRTEKWQARVPLSHLLSYWSKWRQLRQESWPKDVSTCEEDIIVVDNRSLLCRPGGELVRALASERGEELGEVESCVGGLQNILLEWGSVFSYYGCLRRLFRSYRELFTGYRKCAG